MTFFHIHEFLCRYSMSVLEPSMMSSVDLALETKSKKKQLRRMKQRLRRRERRRNQADSVFSVHAADVGVVSGPCVSENLPLAQIWDRVQVLILQWLDMYSSHGICHNRLLTMLLGEKLILKTNGSLSMDSTWLKNRLSNPSSTGCLLAVLDQLEGGMSQLSFSPVAVKNAAVDQEIVYKLKETSYILKFKNSAQNSSIDIQKYLQEKLDVLEFIQSADSEICIAPSEVGSSASRTSRKSSMRRWNCSSRIRSSSIASAKTKLQKRKTRGDRFFANLENDILN